MDLLRPAVLCLLAIGRLCAVSQGEAIRLREELPAAARQWLNRVPGQAAGFLLAPADPSGEACEDAYRGLRKWKEFGLHSFLIQPSKGPGCSGVPNGAVIPASADDGPFPRPDGRWRLILVTPDAKVRLIRSYADNELARATADGRAWDEGRRAFSLHCGHCHGDDGAGTSYANIKSLAGVADRLTPEKIIEGGQNFGAVDLAGWRKSGLDALLLFIDGL
jgi:cytochrome c553